MSNITRHGNALPELIGETVSELPSGVHLPVLHTENKFSDNPTCGPDYVPAEQVFFDGALAIDRENAQVFIRGEPVVIAPKEYSVLELLFRTPDSFVSKEEIYRKAWHVPESKAINALTLRAVTVQISKIRKNIEPHLGINPTEMPLIASHFNFGYGFLLSQIRVK